LATGNQLNMNYSVFQRPLKNEPQRLDSRPRSSPDHARMVHGLPSDRDEVVRLQDALNRLDDEGNNFFDAAARNGWCLNLQAKA